MGEDCNGKECVSVRGLDLGERAGVVGKGYIVLSSVCGGNGRGVECSGLSVVKGWEYGVEGEVGGRKGLRWTLVIWGTEDGDCSVW